MPQGLPILVLNLTTFTVMAVFLVNEEGTDGSFDFQLREIRLELFEVAEHAHSVSCLIFNILSFILRNIIECSRLRESNFVNTYLL